MQKLWDNFRKKQQQQQINQQQEQVQQQGHSTTSPGQGRKLPASRKLSLSRLSSTTSIPESKVTTTNVDSNAAADPSHGSFEFQESTCSSSPATCSRLEAQCADAEAIFTFCKPKTSEEMTKSTVEEEQNSPAHLSAPIPPSFSSCLTSKPYLEPPGTPPPQNLPLPVTSCNSSSQYSRPISKSMTSEPQSPTLSPPPKSSSSSPCFLSPSPDHELLFDPSSGSKLELPNQSRSISYDDVRKYKKSSSGSIGGLILKGKTTSPVAHYHYHHHERSASMVGEDLSPMGLEVPSSAKSTRSKSFDAAAAARNPHLQQPGQEGNAQVMSGTSTANVIASGSSATITNVGKRRVRGSGGFLEIPKWKMLIRRSSAAANSSSSANSPGTPGQSVPGGISSLSSTFTVDQAGMFWRDCIHCILLIEQLKISPPVSHKGSLSSEGSQETENEGDKIMSGVVLGSGRARSASCQSTFEGEAMSLFVTCAPTSSSSAAACSNDENNEEMKMIERAVDAVTAAYTPGPASSTGSPSPIPVVTLSFAPDDENQLEEEDLGNGVTVISLEVPVLPKSGRSASMDSSYLQVPRRPDVADFELPPGKSIRSRSVDIALPVGSDGPYIIVPSERPIPATTQKAIQGEIKISTENGETRTLRCAPDWSETAINGDHLWVPTSTSGGDLCYVGDTECSKQGPRLCCPVCKITAHTGCIGILIDKIKFHCRPTFKDVGIRQYREQTAISHHWVHRRHEKGRCKHCSKSFQSKLSFGNKEIVALSCSWCKSTYHNKENCFSLDRLSEMCRLGPHGDLVVPPSWIVKLPRKGSFKSSIRRSPKTKRASSKRRSSTGKKDNNNSSSGQVASSDISSEQQHGSNNSRSSIDNNGNDDITFPVVEQPVQYRHRASLTPEDGTGESPSPPPIISDHRPSSGAGGHRKSISGSLHRSFAIKPIPSSSTKPLLVFINPKSGGNQGGKLIQKFQWLLNPRQVFDLNQGGPKPGLELYKKVPNLRILACGGDGTAGWIFSALDDVYGYSRSCSDASSNPVQQSQMPPVAILPLGTGNDLSRAFGWGGGYTDEPVSKILFNVKDGDVVQLDRWDLFVEPNKSVQTSSTGDVIFNELSSSSSATLLDDDVNLNTSSCSSSSKDVRDNLPTNVINNYFSIGVDAHIALEFHEAREAHPERFNSRLRNKMFYGQAGGKDLLQRKWKDLCNYITLECDGVDLTQRLRDLKIHSLLFLNIPSYGGGTRPWGGTSPGYAAPSTDDQLIEVVGLTTYQLPLLQAGGHGSCIAQCKSANIVTSRTIPMQVDGEPCRLLPSIIQLRFRNQANVIAKAKAHSIPIQAPTLEKITISIRKLNISDYETYHYEKEKLREFSVHLGDLTIKPNLELDRVRCQINQLVSGIVEGATNALQSASVIEDVLTTMKVNKQLQAGEWCFIDSCTAERYFRVDRAQEHLHYVLDICNEDLYILDEDNSENILPFSEEKDREERHKSEEEEGPNKKKKDSQKDNKYTKERESEKKTSESEPSSTNADGGLVATNTDCEKEQNPLLGLTSTVVTIPAKEKKLKESEHKGKSNEEKGVDGKLRQEVTCSSCEQDEEDSNNNNKDRVTGSRVTQTDAHLDGHSSSPTPRQLPQHSFNPSVDSPHFEVTTQQNPDLPAKVHEFGNTSRTRDENHGKGLDETTSKLMLKHDASSCLQERNTIMMQKDDPEPSLSHVATLSSSEKEGSDAVNTCQGTFYPSGALGAKMTQAEQAVNLTPPTSSSPCPSALEAACGFISPAIDDLFQAVKSNDIIRVKYLHENQLVNINASDKNGMTILHLASQLGHVDIVQFLISTSPCLMEMRNREGRTSLHEAARCCQRKVVGMLAVAGSKLELTDRNGCTAKNLAIQSHDQHLAAYLEHFERYQNTSKETEFK